MRKKILILLMLFSLLTLTACEKKETNNSDAIKFKEEYESKNDTLKSVSISSNNPFIYKTADDIINMKNNKETFLVFIGKSDDELSRDSIESLISVSYDNDLDTIYYVNSDYDKLFELIDKSEAIPVVFNVLNGEVEDVSFDLNKDGIEDIIKDTVETLNTCNSEC